MAESVRSGLVAGGDPTLVGRAAELLRRHLEANGGRMRSRDLPLVDPSFAGLGVGLAAATGLLSAAKAGRRRHDGHDVVAFVALDDAEAVAGLGPAPSRKDRKRAALTPAEHDPTPKPARAGPATGRARAEPPSIAVAAARGEAYERRLLAAAARVEAVVRDTGGIEAEFLACLLGDGGRAVVGDAVRMLARKGWVRTAGRPRCVFPGASAGSAGPSAKAVKSAGALYADARAALLAMSRSGACLPGGVHVARKLAELPPNRFERGLDLLESVGLATREGMAVGASRAGLAFVTRLRVTSGVDAAGNASDRTLPLLVASELSDFTAGELRLAVARAGGAADGDQSAAILDLEARGLLVRRRSGGVCRYSVTEGGMREADALSVDPDIPDTLATVLHSRD